MRRLSKDLGKQTLSRREIDSKSRISSGLLIKRFGSLRKAHQHAGLIPARFMKATDSELYELLYELWVLTLEQHGRSPYKKDLKTFGIPISSDTFVRRFGSWNKALSAAASFGTQESLLSQSAIEPLLERTTERKSLSVRKRFFVFKRDSYTCRICKRSGLRLEVDHIIPVEQDGSDALDNLQTLCWDCNRGKRNSLQ